MMNPPPPTVLVTGCSSGIGRCIARLLAGERFHVLAGVRSDRQADLLTDCQLPTLQPVLLDVTRDADVRRVAKTIADRPAGLFGLVNNAGVGLPAAVELSAMEDVRRLLEINTIGPLRLIQQCLPLLRTGRGRVVNISSINGTMAMPMVGVYSASKYALEALSHALRVELRPWNIPVSLIRPGRIQTSIFDKARPVLADSMDQIPEELRSGYGPLYARASRYNEQSANSAVSPEAVSRVVLRALEARWPRACYTVGMDARALSLAQVILPRRIADRLIARVVGVFGLRA